MKTLRKILPMPLTLPALLLFGLSWAAVMEPSVKGQSASATGSLSDAGIGAAGSYQEDANGVFTVVDSGTDIWGRSDSFHFVYQALYGDGEISARVLGLNGTNGWAHKNPPAKACLAGKDNNECTAATVQPHPACH